MSSVIVFDAYNADSVISAAIVKTLNATAIACPSYSDIKEFQHYEEFIWVGVEPSQALLGQLKKCKHVVAGAWPPSNADGDSNAAFLSQDLSDATPNSLVWKVASIANIYSGEMLALAAALDQFNNNTRLMPLLDQALIYSNLKEATACLFIGKQFTLQEADLLGFTNNLKYIKGKLPTVLVKSSMKIKGIIERVPYVNTSAEMAPWLMKFLSIHYDNIILYEHMSNKIIVVPWSRDVLTKSDMLMTLHSKATRDHRVVFSNFAG